VHSYVTCRKTRTSKSQKHLLFISPTSYTGSNTCFQSNPLLLCLFCVHPDRITHLVTAKSGHLPLKDIIILTTGSNDSVH